MGALRDIEFFLADHNSCGGLQVRTCPPTSAVGYYLALTCCCGGVRGKRAVFGQAVFKPLLPVPPSTANRLFVSATGNFQGYLRTPRAGPPPTTWRSKRRSSGSRSKHI